MHHIYHSYILLYRYELDNLYNYYIGKTIKAYEKII